MCGNLTNALVFALVCTFISGAITTALDLLFGRGAAGSLMAGELPVGTVVIVAILAALIGVPFLGALFVFIIAGVYHLFVVIFVRRSHAGFEATFEATFKASAYARAVALVNWIPVVGSLLSLYGLYLTIVGIRELHSTTTARAATAVLIPASVALLIVLSLIRSLVGVGALL